MSTMKRWAFVLVLLLGACGPGPVTGHPGQSPTGLPTGSESPGTTPAPSPAHLGLLVVLEARRAGSTFGGGPDAYDAHDVVAIPGTDGYAKAKQTFNPRSLPFTANAGVVMQPEARVAGGAVFYIDGNGVVRRLSVDGTIVQV